MRSEFQYEKKFIPSAIRNATIMPPAPPIAKPAITKIDVRSAIKNPVRSVFTKASWQRSTQLMYACLRIRQVLAQPMIGISLTQEEIAARIVAAGARALAEAAARRAVAPSPSLPIEKGGPPGAEPTRFGDWEKKGLICDF